MRIFVTGASGFIGSAVVRELIAAGHQVVGLSRSDKTAGPLLAAGAEVHRGDLDDLDSLRSGAAGAEGVIHLAFKHDFSDYEGGIASDLRAIEAIGTALADTGKPFIITGGTLGLSMALPPGQLATEETASGSRLPRGESESLIMALAGRGVRASVVRLSPTVHGEGDHGFVPALIAIARATGVSAYIGDGTNRWPAVHRLDAARLFRLAVEEAPAGSRLHGVAEEGVPFRDIAGVIGRRLNLPVVSISREEADAHFGFLGALAGLDNRTSSRLTQELLNWQPVQTPLLEDLEAHYFNS